MGWRGKERGRGGMEGLVGDGEEEEVRGRSFAKPEAPRWKMNDDEGNPPPSHVASGDMTAPNVPAPSLPPPEVCAGGGGVVEEESRDEERELSDRDLRDCWADRGDGGSQGRAEE